MLKPTFRMVALVALLLRSLLECTGAFAFSSKQTPAPGPASTPAAASVWIVRSDGAQSCEPKSGQSLDDGAADLKKARVRVLESRKGTDGKMHMQMCGALSGTTNAFLIPREDLPQAVALGYRESK